MAEAASAKSDIEMKNSEDVTTLSVEDSDASRLEAARQIEFYFGDSNLPYDKFMWTLHTQNSHHWVPLGTIASFKRMRVYSPLGIPWLVEAIKEKSTLLELDEKGENVRRTTEVQEPVGAFDRSVYAKGFPEEDPTLQRCEEKSPLKSFLEADPKPSFEGEELLIMSKDAYVKMKCKEKGITAKDTKKRKDGPSRGFNAFIEMKKEKGKNSQAATPKEVFLEFMGNKIKIHVVPKVGEKTEDTSGIPDGLQPGEGYVIPSEVPITRGATLKFAFKEPMSEIVWKDLKTPLKAIVDNRAPFTKFEKGATSGLVSFHRKLEESEIEKVKEALPSLDGKEMEWSLADEDDEKLFQLERAQTAAKSALSFSGSTTSNRGGAKGGRGGKRGRGGSSRGGRGGHNGSRNAEKKDSEEVGEKRKRAVEPDGGPDVGIRGVAAPPTITTSTSEENTSKKAKLDSDAS